MPADAPEDEVTTLVRHPSLTLAVLSKSPGFGKRLETAVIRPLDVIREAARRKLPA